MQRQIGPIRLIIADDHAVLRQALHLMLNSRGEIDVVAEAANGREAVQAAAALQPDIVLMDVAMPGLSGLEATSQIHQRFKHIRVIMLTAYMEEERIIDALRAGAMGFVVKNSDFDELLMAIHKVMTGETYFSREISDCEDIHRDHWLIRSGNGKSGHELLTRREREVLQLIGEGHQNQRIGADLEISVRTVEVHKDHIMKKVGARSRGDLIRYALLRGLVPLDRPASSESLVTSASPL
jgi:two-component system response regulator NreC